MEESAKSRAKREAEGVFDGFCRGNGIGIGGGCAIGAGRPIDSGVTIFVIFGLDAAIRTWHRLSSVSIYLKNNRKI